MWQHWWAWTRRWTGAVACPIFVLGLVSMSSAAVAQEATTGTIEGQVVDAQGLAIPGATVTISGAQGDRTFVTDADGRFLAPFLTPGQYTVRVELQGFRPVSVDNVDVALGSRVSLGNVTMRVGGLQETVEVVGTEPTVDLTTTAVGANIESEFLARLPVQRQIGDVLQLAPGVADSGGAGDANPSISGASGLENQYIIDGVNITNSGYGAIGSYSIVFGSLGTGVPFDFIKEVQVRAGGYEAEFGQATGGVVQAVTKSGGNQFRGSFFGYWQPEAFQADFTQVVLPAATRSEAINQTDAFFSDVGFEVGGPVWRDRVFFFGALDRNWDNTKWIAPEDFPLRDLGDVERERGAVAYSGKVTYQVNSQNRLDFSVFGDPSQGDLGPQRPTALLRTDLAAFSEIEYGGHNQTLRYEGVITPAWLVSASVARATNSLEEFPSVDTWSVEDHTVGDVPVFSGGLGFFEVGNDGENIQYQAKTTYLWRGHEFRGGFLVEDISYDNIIDRTGPTFTLPDGTQTATGAQIDILPDPTFGRIFRVTRANITNVRSTEQRYFAFFLQDTWQLTDRLTIKPGLRYEQQKLIGNLEDFTWDGNWAPRIGAVYDPMGQGRWKIFGNWGRYFAKVPNDLAARALSADAGVTQADYFDAALTQPIPEGVPTGAGETLTTTHFLTAGLSASEFDPDSKSTYSDEWLVGTEYELIPGFSLGINYIHRNFGRVLEDVGTLPMIAYFLEDVPGADSVEYFITNPDADTPVAGDVGFPISFEEAIHDYDAVTLTAEKRFGDRWALQSSYRWSRLHGTFEGFFRNDNGQSDPAITSLFDFPTNDPSYVALGRAFGFEGDIRFLGAAGAGPLPLDRPHMFKLYGNYVFPIGVNVGVGFTTQSGTPLTALAANPVYQNDGEIPVTPRGEGFETVDGFRDRTPWLTTFDAHVDYRLQLFGDREIVLLADVFNLFDTQEVTGYDNYTESTFTVPNADFGRVLSYQRPRQLRIGARFGW